MQSLILQIAQNWLEQEKRETEEAKEAYMAEHCPAPDLNGDQAALMVSTWFTHRDAEIFQRTIPSFLSNSGGFSPKNMSEKHTSHLVSKVSYKQKSSVEQQNQAVSYTGFKSV